LRVGGFVDNGGLITGNPPLSNAAQLVIIESISLSDPVGIAVQGTSPDMVKRAVNLRWSAPPAHQFKIETSHDLYTWTEQSSLIQEIANGQYRAWLPASEAAHMFIRLRWDAPE
jgi:hypothetical protein